MAYLWQELRSATSILTSGDPYLFGVLLVTIRVAIYSTVVAVVLGLPIGVAIGLGNFRGRRILQTLANASLALPPVVVGVVLLMLLVSNSVLGGLRIEFTIRGVYVAQTILALPYIVALTPAAIQGLPPGLLDQARALGASRPALSRLALREAKIGVLAAVIAALGSALAEVGAVIIVGGNIQSSDQTLASAALSQINDYSNFPMAIALGLLLMGLILLLIGALTVIQQRTSGIRLRFRTV